MTPLVDNVADIAARLKEIEEAKEKARTTPATEKPQKIENHEWSFSIDNIYSG
jgi:hypothetical protein